MKPNNRKSEVRRAEVTPLKPVENFLRIVAETDSEVIDEMHGAALVDLRVEDHLREGRATVNECATGVVADAAEHGRRCTRNR